jgi:ankyrin repeat protein
MAHRVNPSIQFRGKSILNAASTNGYTDIVKVLLDAGADITAKDRTGMTALQCAAKGKHREIVTMLLVKAKELKNQSIC